MPQVFKIGSYWVYFLSNENDPLEPIHVHVFDGKPQADGTKIRITESGKCFVENNNSQIPEKVLRNIVRVLEAHSAEIIEKWISHFGEVHFYC